MLCMHDARATEICLVCFVSWRSPARFRGASISFGESPHFLLSKEAAEGTPGDQNLKSDAPGTLATRTPAATVAEWIQSTSGETEERSNPNKDERLLHLSKRCGMFQLSGSTSKLFYGRCDIVCFMRPGWLYCCVHVVRLNSARISIFTSGSFMSSVSPQCKLGEMSALYGANASERTFGATPIASLQAVMLPAASSTGEGRNKRGDRTRQDAMSREALGEMQEKFLLPVIIRVHVLIPRLMNIRPLASA